MGHSMDNTETQATLGTRRRTKTSKTKTQHRKVKDKQYGPHEKNNWVNPVLAKCKKFLFLKKQLGEPGARKV